MKRYRMTQPDEAGLDKLIVRTQLQPLLSNAKWVKLLTGLVQQWPAVQECQVKLIWEADYSGRYNFDYYAQAMEAMVSGAPRGWYAYREVEWLTFPQFTSGKGVVQDVDALQQHLEAIGQFRLVRLPDSLRLYAYHRPL
jgi:hypothetical protein